MLADRLSMLRRQLQSASRFPQETHYGSHLDDYGDHVFGWEEWDYPITPSNRHLFGLTPIRHSEGDDLERELRDIHRSMMEVEMRQRQVRPRPTSSAISQRERDQVYESVYQEELRRGRLQTGSQVPRSNVSRPVLGSGHFEGYMYKDCLSDSDSDDDSESSSFFSFQSAARTTQEARVVQAGSGRKMNNLSQKPNSNVTGSDTNVLCKDKSVPSTFRWITIEIV